MPIHSETHLHYCCCFELSRKTDAAAGWSDIVKTVRDWVTEGTGPQDAFGGKWFYTGGEWRSKKADRIHVHTVASKGKGEEEAPEHWAIRFVHPCEDVRFRQWQTDIGITSLDSDHYFFALMLTHSMMPGYLGDEPPSPNPSAPNIVVKLLNSIRWSATLNGDTMTTSPSVLKPGEGDRFVRRLTEAHRAPVILVTLEFGSQRFKLNPKRLAKLVAGTASVFEAATSEVDKELEWVLLKKDFRCYNGMIRIYQPGVDFEKTADSKRHRFIAADDDSDSRILEEKIVRSIVRRSRRAGEAGVSTVEDVLEKQREFHLAELRADPDRKNSPEWIEELETENKRLSEEKRAFSELLQQFRLLNDELDDKVDYLETDNRNVRAQLDNIKIRRQTEAPSDPGLARALEAALGGKPTLVEGLTVISFLFPDRIVVLDSAWRSAKTGEKADYKEEAFVHLRNFASEFWLRLSNGEGYASAAQIFGKAFAPKESETVENNQRARKLRTFEYDGEWVEMMAHLKTGRKPSDARTWRMHFWWDSKKKKLVIGHCGKHLDHD